MQTFKDRIHPCYFRELTHDKSLREAELPETAVIPLSQHIGAPAEPVGKVGTLIGRSAKYISTSVHSSLSGKVAVIENRPHPILGNIFS